MAKVGRKRIRRGTEFQRAYIKKWWGEKPRKVIARTLGLSKWTCDMIASELGVTNYYTPRHSVPVPKDATKRPCLCCGRAFPSEGPHNRLCNPCRGLSLAEPYPVLQ